MDKDFDAAHERDMAVLRREQLAADFEDDVDEYDDEYDDFGDDDAYDDDDFA